MTMRKIILSVVLALLLIFTSIFIVKGLDNLNIAGIKGIIAKSDEIDQKNIQLSNLIGVTYENSLSNLKSSANILTQTKTEYENQAILSNSNNSSYISQQETYDIDYLWTKLGNYAKDEGVVIKIELTSNGANSKLYNLNFTVTGEYVSITDFIYDIENDSKLGFKIDEFKITGTDQLNATFSCKEIPITVGKIDASVTEEKETTDKEDTTNSTKQNTSTNTSTTDTVNNSNS